VTVRVPGCSSTSWCDSSNSSVLSPDGTVPFLPSSPPGVVIVGSCSSVSEPGLPRLSHVEILVPVVSTLVVTLLSDFFSVPRNHLTVSSRKDPDT
jgi:hypothetical protein